MSESEKIIKNRLINDGEGKNADKRLNSLLKNFLEWTNSNSKTEEENRAEINQLCAQIGTCNLEARKDELVFARIEEESANYDKDSKELDEQIADAKKELASLYPKSEKANEQRLAELRGKIIINEIKTLPPVDVQTKEIEGLEKELAELQENSAALDKHMEKARANYGLLMHALQQLANPWTDGEAMDIDGNSENNARAAVQPAENLRANPFGLSCQRLKEKFCKTQGKKNKEAQE